MTKLEEMQMLIRRLRINALKNNNDDFELRMLDLLCEYVIIEERYNDGSHYTKDEHGRFTGSTSSGKAAISGSGDGSRSDILADKQARFLYDKMTREERKEVISRGQKIDKPVFSYNTPKNDAMARLARTKPIPNTFDVKVHGSKDCIDFFEQDYPQNDRRRRIDAYTLSCILKGRNDYKAFVADCKQHGVKPTVRLLSCDTGNTTDTENCFAQLLANELGHNVSAPTDTMYAKIDGTFYVGDFAGGSMKNFVSRK